MKKTDAYNRTDAEMKTNIAIYCNCNYSTNQFVWKIRHYSTGKEYKHERFSILRQSCLRFQTDTGTPGHCLGCSDGRVAGTGSRHVGSTTSDDDVIQQPRSPRRDVSWGDIRPKHVSFGCQSNPLTMLYQLRGQMFTGCYGRSDAERC